jgi:hypothetical protein
MRTFAMESDRMENTQEVMGDAIDGVMEGEGEEEEADDIVSQVMMELNLKMGDALPSVGAGQLSTGATAVAQPQQKVAAAMGAGGVGGGSSGGNGGAGGPPSAPGGGNGGGGGGGGGGGMPAAAPAPTPAPGGAGAMSDLQARLDALKKQ